ncbi:Phosphoethanolamine N-methyltransferase 3-like protein 1 [Fusarium oxysporum f. sp. phaseoli]
MQDQSAENATQHHPTDEDSRPGSPLEPNELVPADDDSQDEHDSSLGTGIESSTASISSSILEYRLSQGRTYHSDKFTSNYFVPNDDRQLDSMDLTHHYLTLLLDDKLFLAPVDTAYGAVFGLCTIVKHVCDCRVLMNHSELADRYPNMEVIGTDLSPCQPQWVPPNVRFEIDDAAQSWTWNDDHFHFIHIRYLFGAINDWNALFREAHRCCEPGGWIQSCEADVTFRSDDGTTELEPAFQTWRKLYEEGGKKLGNPTFVHGLQRQAIEEAGFTGVKVTDYKFPIGDWPKDPKLAEIGQYVKATLENDLEGYTVDLWHVACKWPEDEYQVFLMSLRKAIRNPKVHSYMTVRYIYGRKAAERVE